MRGIQTIRSERCLEEFHASFNSRSCWSNISGVLPLCITLYFATKDLVRPFLKSWEIQRSRCKIFQVLENAKAEQSLEKLYFSEITWRKFPKLSKPWQNSLHTLGACTPHGSSPCEPGLYVLLLPQHLWGALMQKACAKTSCHRFQGSTSVCMQHQPLSRGMPFVSMCWGRRQKEESITGRCAQAKQHWARHCCIDLALPDLYRGGMLNSTEVLQGNPHAIHSELWEH